MDEESKEPIRDDVDGRRYYYLMVRECPEPRVIKKYGTGGIVHVSIYTCKLCKHHIEHKLHGGISCGYGLGKSV